MLELDLRAALPREEFEVHYQPIRDFARDRVVAFEALVRWNHPLRGMIAPINFIPLAEETGLIVALGEWVLRQACLDAAGWPEDIDIAVNLSPIQFKNPNLVSSVKAALEASGLPARRLELEITESVLLQNSEATLAVLHELRAFGVRISLDDFGTGYSSLSYLRSFPFDKIKIDRSFVSELATRDNSMAIVRAVTGLGKISASSPRRRASRPRRSSSCCAARAARRRRAICSAARFPRGRCWPKHRVRASLPRA